MEGRERERESGMEGREREGEEELERGRERGDGWTWRGIVLFFINDFSLIRRFSNLY